MALSTHPGGAADKAGVIYESLWGVRAFLAVLNGEATSIRIETPGEDGEEFYLLRGSVREHWQAKRQVTEQDTWSLQRLKVVLKFFFEKFRIGERCVFASVSDAPELRMLSQNARAAASLDEFREHFLSKGREKQFAELGRLLGSQDEDELFNYLRSVTVENSGEVTLKSLLECALGATFQGASLNTIAVLRDLYLHSTRETLTAADIERHLQTRRITKRYASSPDAQNRISALTKTYIVGQRAKMIRGTPIRRAVADAIIGKFQDKTAPLDLFITSAAGGGKSACLSQIVEGLQAAHVPVLAFRLDLIEPVVSTIALGEKLGLIESPALVLADNYPGQTVVLVIDQLDCLSTTSGRHPGFFDTIAALRDEVIGLRSRTRVHIVMACRKFDLEHDHRLKRLLSKNQAPVVLDEFTADEVKAVLAEEGGDISKLALHQQTMLQLPQNLSLFVQAELASTENRFTTPKELCDAYWHAKRKAVSAQRPEFDALWMPAIQNLATRMSDRQELSVAASTMDGFPSEFLEKMASEGVITSDSRRFGFGHETFFDYCFARTQPNNGRDFVSFLENDAQHLFRRAQLRQVLAFLRDDDFNAYLESVGHLLRSEGIRPHLKLLTVELVAAHPEPRDEELLTLMPWIDSEMACRRTSILNPDRLASRIFDSFFASGTLFVVADRLGFVQRWLQSAEEWLLNTMCSYLRWLPDQHSERVAELLEPFSDGRDGWGNRLRHIMEGRGLGKSRRYFDLFLRLLDDGTLDDAKDQFVSNGTFWSMLHGFANERPAWCAELVAHWLTRRIGVAKSAKAAQEQQYFTLDDQFGVDDLFTSASNSPAAFLENVLPAVIDAAKAFVLSGDGKMTRDQLWQFQSRGEFISMTEALPAACKTAFKRVGQQSPDALRPFMSQLRDSKLYTANYLLMSAYLCCPLAFAEEALELLTDEPERLSCGYFDSPFWISRQVLEKCSPHCTDATFFAMEATVLEFVSPYERTKDGLRWRGNPAFNLATALDAGRRSNRANAQIAEWKTKFGEPDGPPRGLRSYTVVSPIPQESAKLMTDEQWLRAISKYNSPERRHNFEHPELGGSEQLAAVLQEFVKDQPERFAALALRFPESTEANYFTSVLSGLKVSAISGEKKLAVVRRVFTRNDKSCLCAALDMLGAMAGMLLPNDAIKFIRDVTEHSDPESELWDAERHFYGGDILTHGINTVRGHAACSIRNLIQHDARYLGDFSSVLDKLVADPSLAVRSVVASTLLAVARHDTSLALRLTATLLEADDRLLATTYVRDFIQTGLLEHLEHFAPTIERMLRSSRDEVRKQGGILACLARLYHKTANHLAEKALSGDEPCRLGACEVAKSNLLHSECREWCVSVLLRLFDDASKAVRTQAAGCFGHLLHSPDTPLTDYEPLIKCFLESPAFADKPSFLLHALEDTKRRVPEITLDICEIFIDRCAEGARDIRTTFAADQHFIGKLVFSAYAQLQSTNLQSRALKVIDRMSLEGFRSANTHLLNFER